MIDSQVAQRFADYETNVFAKMSRMAHEHGALNLGQGFPDFPGPDFVKEAAVEAIRAGYDQYSPTSGLPDLTRAIAEHYRDRVGLDVDPDTEVTVHCGCTEALAASLVGLVNPGDEVIVFEPYFDTYRPGVALAGGIARFVTLEPPRFAIDPDRLRRAFGPRTRAILVNTPHNPTGKVFSRRELELIAALCREHDAIAIMDEVYENLVFEGEHVSMAALEGMRGRTVTLSSLGKTFSLTGWKVGWSIARPPLTTAIRRAHQTLTFAAATPLQYAAAKALRAPRSYYDDFLAQYRERRGLLVEALEEIGFIVFPPAGTYFVLADHTPFALGDDEEFCVHLTREIGVAAIPPSYFYSDPAKGRDLVRFAFCKTQGVLRQAIDRLRTLQPRRSPQKALTR
jgi:aspartate/methionine/tyrosine aminotransferase